MKKIVSILIVTMMLLSLFAVPASAASTTTYFTANLSKNYSETFFADVLFNGEVVGRGVTYKKSSGLLWLKRTVASEYQNYDLPRTFGKDLGVDITVYSYVKNGSKVLDSDRYSWSDQDWQGGNTLGYITAAAIVSGSDDISEVGGYVMIKNTKTNSSNTYNFVITNKS